VSFDELNANSSDIEMLPQQQCVERTQGAKQQRDRTSVFHRGGKKRKRAYQWNQDERADQANHA
jgi:hypothetical protein